MVYQIKEIYQIKSTIVPDKFNDCWIMEILSWIAFISCGLSFLFGLACLSSFSSWIISLVSHYNTDIYYDMGLIFLFLTIISLIPFKISVVAHEDLTMPNNCMPVKVERSRNKGGFYFIGVPGQR